ncbi:MAG: hypothetical protein PHV49_04635, partial [Alistipes sp.]|nr:hypothetical protein [Alistipes sp.]
MRIAPLLRIVVLGSLPLSGWGQGAVVTSDQASRAEQILTEEAATEPETRWLLTPLEAYDPPFGSLVRYNLGFTRYARRGYPWGEQQQTLQGVTLDHPFTGQSLWNLLRAVRETPHEESVCYGLEGGEASLGGANGVCDYWVVPGKQTQGGYVGWHFTDRRYRQGTRLGLTTGPLGHGWSLLLSGSRRWGRDVHIRGVYADQWSLSAAVEKQWGGRHSLTALFLLAPVEEGVRSSITSDCEELTDNPLYNPSWGEQEGSERSARVRRERLPMGVLTWRFTPDERWSVYLSVAAMYGESSHTQLDWYDASSPQPDYYRYLPSAYDNPTVSAAVREAWRGGDPAVTQIEWT